MTYRLIVSLEAFEALDSFVDYIAVDQQSPLNAERWLAKALKSLRSLRKFPHRCPPAPENDQYIHTIRMLIVDRCLFVFRVDEEAKAVRVLDFRHGSQLPRPLNLPSDG
ncbi:MAG: type II toxin-antitoxin system RelE/ParE family toxin [Planctomycetes bacterium]|nr:type II toxin-antitoxin system RelE/ParE family toxin [Planctomycetota bacterium]